MSRLLRSFFMFFFVTLINGCELVSVNIESSTTPLTQKELNMRLLTREFAAQYFKETEKGADAIVENAQSKSQYNQAVLWKIYAIEGMQLSIFRVSPEAALLDAWIFANQVKEYYSSGIGQSIFGKQQYIAVDTSEYLSTQINQLAKDLLTRNEYKKMQLFVHEFTKNNAFTGHVFTRTPAFQSWLKSQGIDESEAVSTLGTMPEAISDLSDRLSNISTVSPKLLTWKAELIANNSALNGETLGATLDAINQASEKFQDYVINNPEYMRMLAVEMGSVLTPLLEKFDTQTNQKLGLLSLERQAIELLIEKERIAIGVMISTERQSITDSIDKIAQNALKTAISELTQSLSNIILYLIVFIILIFFTPFGLGFLIGKQQARRPQKKH